MRKMKEIKLLINDEDIPLNPIMSTVLSNIILGFVGALKDIPKEKKNLKVEISL